MKVPGSKIVRCQGVLGSNHSLTFGLFTQVSGLGPLGPLVLTFADKNFVLCFLVVKELNSKKIIKHFPMEIVTVDFWRM